MSRVFFEAELDRSRFASSTTCFRAFSSPGRSSKVELQPTKLPETLKLIRLLLIMGNDFKTTLKFAFIQA